MEGIDKSPLQKILNILHRYFALRKVDHNSPLLKCEPCTVISF